MYENLGSILSIVNQYMCIRYIHVIIADIEHFNLCFFQVPCES